MVADVIPVGHEDVRHVARKSVVFADLVVLQALYAPDLRYASPKMRLRPSSIPPIPANRASPFTAPPDSTPV